LKNLRIPEIPRFLIANGTEAMIGFLLLLFLTNIFNLDKILSAQITCAASFVLGFLFKKDFVFKIKNEKNKTYIRLLFYIGLSVLFLFLNKEFLILFVENIKIENIFIAQGLSSIILTILSFLINKFFIFKR